MTLTSRLFTLFERVLLASTQAVALAGGVILVALSCMTVYSVVGRALRRHLAEFALLAWWGPVRGDFELIEMGTAVAIFACLPFTQMVRGNVLVDFFVAGKGPRVKAALAIPADLIFTALALLVSWRMTVATVERYAAPFTQTTMLLRLPIWWGYLLATGCMYLLAAVCLFTLWRSAREAAGVGNITS